MTTILQQMNWRIIGVTVAVLAVGFAGSREILDGGTQQRIVDFLLGGAAGAVAVPSAGLRKGTSV